MLFPTCTGVQPGNSKKLVETTWCGNNSGPLVKSVRSMAGAAGFGIPNFTAVHFAASAVSLGRARKRKAKSSHGNGKGMVMEVMIMIMEAILILPSLVVTVTSSGPCWECSMATTRPLGGSKSCSSWTPRWSALNRSEQKQLQQRRHQISLWGQTSENSSKCSWQQRERRNKQSLKTYQA